jgi:plasmid segregation protein ParM
MAKNSVSSEQQPLNVVALHASNQLRHVGIDDGHSGIKLVTDDGQQFFVPSRVARGGDLIALGDAQDNVYETAAGDEYAVSEALPFMDTTFADYAVSDINRVLVHHALMKANLGGQDVSIVTGLPVGDYFIGNQPNKELIAKKRANLLEASIKHKNDTIVLANIVKHNVLSEAIAAFFDLLLDENGEKRPEIAEMIEHGAIGLIDIGGKTTDSAVIINGGSTVDGKRSGTDNIGALSLNRAVENDIKAAFGASAINPAQLDRAVMHGVVKLYGNDRDCSSIVEAQKELLANQIIQATQRKMRDASDLEKVFFVGGGSLLLRKQLTGLYEHAEFVKDPQFANARGMLKAAKFLDRS